MALLSTVTLMLSNIVQSQSRSFDFYKQIYYYSSIGRFKNKALLAQYMFHVIVRFTFLPVIFVDSLIHTYLRILELWFLIKTLRTD